MIFRKKKTGPEYYFQRGEECLKSGNYQWAIESFSKAIEFNPGFEMAYYQRAEIYKKLGRMRESVSDYIKFLEVDRRQPGMAEDLDDVLKEGFNIARRGWQKDKAKQEIISFGIPKIIEELMEGYDPLKGYNDTQFYDIALSWLKANTSKRKHDLGFVLLIKKDFNEAIKELDKIANKGTENPYVYYFRGVALLNKKEKLEQKGSRFGRKEEKIELFKRAQENFRKALEKGFKWRICPKCGYRTTSMNFCLRCGSKLLY